MKYMKEMLSVIGTACVPQEKGNTEVNSKFTLRLYLGHFSNAVSFPRLL